MNRGELIAVIVKLFIGGMQFVTFDALKTTPVVGLDGKEGSFKRGFFVAFVLFCSVMLAFIPYVYLKRKNPKEVSSIDRRALIRTALSGFCDACAQILVIQGNAKIAVSLLMILKASRAIFSAGLQIVWLRRRLHSYQIWSLVLCTLGLGLASLASFLAKKTTNSNLALGISFVLLAEMFRSVRIVYDEKLMKEYNYEPCMIIALEGVYGTLISGTALIAVNFIGGDDMGSLENLANTIYMIDNSTILIILLALFPIWVNGMYLSGIFVTKYVSAVFNAVLTVATVVVVWLYEIGIHYLVDSRYGAAWNKYSYLQLIGFVVITFATLLYDGTLKIPRLFHYGSSSKIGIKETPSTDDITTVEGGEDVKPAPVQQSTSA
jgi:hypothetical protein